MDFVPSLVGTSDGISSNESTGLLTPDGSPLFRPAYPKDSFGTRLSHVLDDGPKSRTLQSGGGRTESRLTSSHHEAGEPKTCHVRNVCVIGAGYVGMSDGVTCGPLA